MPMKNLCMKNSEVVEQTAEVAAIPDSQEAYPALHSKKETEKTQQDEANRSNSNQVFILVNIVWIFF